MIRLRKPVTEYIFYCLLHFESLVKCKMPPKSTPGLSIKLDRMDPLAVCFAGLGFGLAVQLLAEIPKNPLDQNKPQAFLSVTSQIRNFRCALAEKGHQTSFATKIGPKRNARIRETRTAHGTSFFAARLNRSTNSVCRTPRTGDGVQMKWDS